MFARREAFALTFEEESAIKKHNHERRCSYNRPFSLTNYVLNKLWKFQHFWISLILFSTTDAPTLICQQLSAEYFEHVFLTIGQKRDTLFLFEQ